MKNLTEKQAKLLYFIFKYRGQYGTAPTLREMVQEIKVSDNKSILGIIKSLTKQDYILPRYQKKSRVIQLTDKGQDFIIKNYVLPFKFDKRPFLAVSQLRQQAIMGNASVTVLSPNSELAYKNSPIKTEGTNIENDIRSVVESVVNLAIDKIFNGTNSENHETKYNSTIKISGIIFRLLKYNSIFEIFLWSIVLTGLTWVNVTILGKNLAAFVYSIISLFIIKNLLNK